MHSNHNKNQTQKDFKNKYHFDILLHNVIDLYDYLIIHHFVTMLAGQVEVLVG